MARNSDGQKVASLKAMSDLLTEALRISESIDEPITGAVIEHALVCAEGLLARHETDTKVAN